MFELQYENMREEVTSPDGIAFTLINQPGVEEGKNYTCGITGKKRYDAKQQEVEAAKQKKSRGKV